MADRRQYTEKLKARLDEWNAELDKLEAKAREARADSSITYDKIMGHLREHKNNVASRLEEIERAGEDSWEHLKEGAEKAWHSFTQAVEKARSEFKR